MSFKKPIILSLFFVLLAILAGCDNHAKKATAKPAETLTIEHAQGTTKIPLHPQRVIVLNPATLDIMDALQIPVIGVPQTNAHFPPFLMQYQSKQYINAGTLFEPDYEAISAASPDLIIAGNRAHDAYNKLSEIAPTISLDIDYQHFLASLTQRVELLGKIFNKSSQAKQLINAFTQQIDQIKAKTSHEGSAMVVLITGGKISAFGPGSRFGFLFDDLGFTSATTLPQAGPHGDIVSAELILKANPDWLFVIDRDSAIGRTDAPSAQQVLTNPLVEQTTAWKKHHIVYLHANAMYIAGGLQTYQQLMDDVNHALTQQSATL